MFSSIGSTSESGIGLPDAQQLERRCPAGASSGQVEAQVEIAIRVEPLDALDVRDGGAGGEVVAVRGREGIGVAPARASPPLLAALLDSASCRSSAQVRVGLGESASISATS